MKTVKSLLWAGLIALSLSTAFAKGTIESRWLDREVIVDGMMGEWRDIMIKPGSAPATLGVMNDGTHLYVCLKSWDRRANFQAMSRGLILRLTPKGKGQAGVGIRFPVGLDLDESEGPERPGERDRAGRAEAMAELKASLTVLEVLEDRKDHGQRLPADLSQGFRVHADLHEGMLTYELKIPLKSSVEEPHALGAEPGETVTVAFETAKVELEALPPERGGSLGGGRGGGIGGPGGTGGPGGPGGMGRGRGGMRGGGGPVGGRANLDALKIKTRIRLATAAESGSK